MRVYMIRLGLVLTIGLIVLGAVGAVLAKDGPVSVEVDKAEGIPLVTSPVASPEEAPLPSSSSSSRDAIGGNDPTGGTVPVNDWELWLAIGILGTGAASGALSIRGARKWDVKPSAASSPNLLEVLGPNLNEFEAGQSGFNETRQRYQQNASGLPVGWGVTLPAPQSYDVADTVAPPPTPVSPTQDSSTKSFRLMEDSTKELYQPTGYSDTQKVGWNHLVTYPDRMWEYRDMYGTLLASSDKYDTAGNLDGVTIDVGSYYIWKGVRKATGWAIGVPTGRVTQVLGFLFGDSLVDRIMPVPDYPIGTTIHEVLRCTDVRPMEEPSGVADTQLTFSILRFAVDKDGMIVGKTTENERVFYVARSVCEMDGYCNLNDGESAQ